MAFGLVSKRVAPPPFAAGPWPLPPQWLHVFWRGFFSERRSPSGEEPRQSRAGVATPGRESPRAGESRHARGRIVRWGRDSPATGEGCRALVRVIRDGRGSLRMSAGRNGWHTPRTSPAPLPERHLSPRATRFSYALRIRTDSLAKSPVVDRARRRLGEQAGATRGLWGPRKVMHLKWEALEPLAWDQLSAVDRFGLEAPYAE